MIANDATGGATAVWTAASATLIVHGYAQRDYGIRFVSSWRSSISAAQKMREARDKRDADNERRLLARARKWKPQAPSLPPVVRHAVARCCSSDGGRKAAR